ncbi:hypothetical protein ACFL0V_06760 [Nanoarchaeota archaeon]
MNIMSNRYHTLRLHKKRTKKGIKLPVKPGAFKSEAKAKAWAKENGITDFRVEAISESKFKIRTN